MAGLLGRLKKHKSPEQLVLSAVEMLDQGQDDALAKRLSQIKFVLYGEEEKEPDDARYALYCTVSSFCLVIAQGFTVPYSSHVHRPSAR